MSSLSGSPTIKTLGATRTWVPIGFRGRGFPGSKGLPTPEDDPANDSFQDETAWMSPSWADATAIRLVYAGFDLLDSGPQDRPTTVTGAASAVLTAPTFNLQTTGGIASAGATQITVNSTYGVKVGAKVTAQSPNGASIAAGTYVTATYPTAGGTTLTIDLSAALAADLPDAATVGFTGIAIPATFGGRRQMLIEPRRGLVKSDPIPMYLPASTAFFVKTFGAITGGTTWHLQEGGTSGSSYISGEANVRGTGLADHTQSAVQMTTTAGSGHWGPVWIEALLDSATAVVAIGGDSNAHGIGDTGDSYGRTGFIQKSLANDIAWLAMTRGGANAAYFATRDNTMRSLAVALVDSGVTDFIVQWCRNDLLALGRSATLVLSDLQTIAAMLELFGIRAWACTSTPYTTGAWTSAGGQTIPDAGREAERLTYNAAMRNGGYAGYGFRGLIDIAAVIEDDANPGKWKSTGGTARTTDGTHLNATAVTEAVAAQIVYPTMFRLY